ncbi:MAG: metal ABC transporter substrate-binding protein [Candidatus Bipolaricaulaceae bacterium]
MRRMLWLILPLLVALPAAGHSPVPVVATSAVLADLTQAVGGDRVTVTTLIPAGFCPAHYDLRPSDLLAVARAELILYHGFEPWLEGLLANVNPDAQAQQLAGGWNTPAPLIAKAETIRDVLAEIAPQWAEEFSDRAEEFADRVRELGEQILTRAGQLGLGQVPAVVMAWQADFATWLGLKVAITYPPEENLSLKDLAELVDAGRAAQAALVVDNLQSGVSFGSRLAHELGAVHVVLTNFPGALPGARDVLAMLRVNADAVFSAVAAVGD